MANAFCSGMEFCAFARMVEAVPPAGIFRAVELQGQMLVNDVVTGRTDFNNEIFSILCFWRYLAAAKEGRIIGGFAVVPFEQIEFYKHIILKMVTAGELAHSALTGFGAIPEISAVDAEENKEAVA